MVFQGMALRRMAGSYVLFLFRLGQPSALTFRFAWRCPAMDEAELLDDLRATG
jgi:hypothetical protein